MCGIVFMYRPDLSKSEMEHRGADALRSIRHRGPDERGLHCDPTSLVGHARLSIIDLSSSHQPMLDPSGRFVLSYNGEVYNFLELRKHLQGRWEFLTEGDTETVLAGLTALGSSFLDSMEGMWALALWDRRDRKLLLARDRMGKKPLYFREIRGGIACASELPALARLTRENDWEEDLDSTADYFRYGYYLPGTTAYRDVREVLPAHTLTWSPEEGVSSQRYWSLPVGSYQGTRGEARRQLRQKLRNSIERRLVSDVEVGAFLSGGVDSSLVVSLLAKELGIRPKTFTIGFSDPAFDESSFARQVAANCATDHYEDRLESWDSGQLEDLVLDHIGQPFADSSLLPTTLVSGLASKHVKVALSGDGGDELFSGYQRYQARAILSWYTRLPPPLRSSLERVIRAIPEPMAHHSRSLLKKAHLFTDTIGRLDSETPYVGPVMYSAAGFAALVPDLVGRGHKPPVLPSECRLDDIHQMMVSDALVYLPQDILAKVDRASMAHSIETRAPFLDRALVEFAFQLPRYWHRRGLSGKRMLKETFRDLLPGRIWNRRKQGFGVPVHRWFRKELGHELERLLVESQAPLSIIAVKRILEDHRNSRRDHGNRLWALYVYLLWRQRGRPNR